MPKWPIRKTKRNKKKDKQDKGLLDTGEAPPTPKTSDQLISQQEMAYMQAQRDAMQAQSAAQQQALMRGISHQRHNDLSQARIPTITTTSVASNATVSVGLGNQPPGVWHTTNSVGIHAGNIMGTAASGVIIDDVEAPGGDLMRGQVSTTEVLEIVNSYCCETEEEQDAVDNIIMHIKERLSYSGHATGQDAFDSIVKLMTKTP